MSDTNPTVAQIMRRETPSVVPDASIAQVAKLLVDLQIAGVPVVENDKIIGIITEADLIAREADVEVPTPVPFLDAIFQVDAGAAFPEELRKVTAVTARDLMSSPVISIRDSATLTEVATVIIDQRVNPLPVLDSDLSYVGIVSRKELVQIISALENADK